MKSSGSCGHGIQDIQELLGHNSIETTMIYTHVVRELKTAAAGPAMSCANTFFETK
ncbi:MAG: tyrosine-type recombinase/integrase [Lentisphaeria bacterium]|nr:tyrosine-type recombinase/integrase [Lentisphaeria bacterium]